MFGSSVVVFALVWYVNINTDTAVILSTAIIMNMLPIIFLGPFIGPLVDRWNRKKIMIYSDLITMLLTVLLVFLFYTDMIQIWHIYVVVLLRGISGTFQAPALTASIPMIVPEKNLVRANGLNNTLYGAINLIGPPAGAFLMEALPMHWVLSVEIITALLAVGILIPLEIPKPLKETLSQKVNIIKDMRQGFRYIVSWRSLLFLTMTGAVVNFIAVPGEMLLPVFVKSELGNQLKLGWLQGAFGLGIVAGGLIIGTWGGFKKRIMTIFVGFIIYCIAIFMFGFTTNELYIMGVFMWLIAGIANGFFNAPMGAILQSNVPRDMQGRVFSVLGSINTALIPISLAIFGPVVDAIGMPMLYHIIGIGVLIIVLIGFYFGKVMNIEEQKTAEEPVTDNNFTA